MAEAMLFRSVVVLSKCVCDARPFVGEGGKAGALGGVATWTVELGGLYSLSINCSIFCRWWGVNGDWPPEFCRWESASEKSIGVLG